MSAEETLERVKNLLEERYPKLTILKNALPFLHIFKPVENPSQELGYLPLFHTVVTMDLNQIIFTLYTYHGRPLSNQLFDISEPSFDSCHDLEDMADGRLDFCSGIGNLNESMVDLSDFSSALKMLQNSFLIESFGKGVAIRSQKCLFKVNIETRCSECQMKLENDDIKDFAMKSEEEFFDDETFEPDILEPDLDLEVKPKKNALYPTVKLEKLELPLDEEEDEEDEEDAPLKRRKKKVIIQRQHFKHQCKVCLKLFRSKSYLDRCMKKHESFLNLNRPASCPLCNQNFRVKDRSYGSFC